MREGSGSDLGLADDLQRPVLKKSPSLVVAAKVATADVSATGPASAVQAPDLPPKVADSSVSSPLILRRPDVSRPWLPSAEVRSADEDSSTAVAVPSDANPVAQVPRPLSPRPMPVVTSAGRKGSAFSPVRYISLP